MDEKFKQGLERDKEEVTPTAEEAKAKVVEKAGELKNKAQTTKGFPAVAVLIVLLAAAVLYSALNPSKTKSDQNAANTNSVTALIPGTDAYKQKEAAKKADEIKKLIEENVLPEGVTAEVTNVTEVGGLYKFKLALSGQEYDAYITKDQKLLFPQALDIEQIKEEKKKQEEEQQKARDAAKAEVPKADKPKVELFVMSECPYGTQVEKGILPVVKALGDKIDFQVKFVNYAMHGEKELREQMRQFCITQKEPQKYLSYLECYLGAGESDQCVGQAGLNGGEINACESGIDQQFGVMAKFADKTTWKDGQYPVFPIHDAENQQYTIEGSPTLVINGQKIIDSGRDAKNLMGFVCAGFNNAPEECKQNMSDQTPKPGFGWDGQSQDASSTCE